jgi:hypothetical protein
MSNRGLARTQATKDKISVSQSKITKAHLVNAYNEYVKELEENPDTLPTLTGYANKAKVNYKYLYQLTAKYSDLTDILDDIRQRQEHYLLTKGIVNKANTALTIFLLKAKHDYKDSPNQLTQNNYMNISPEVLGEALKLMNKNEK